jgi:hypothetical protein
MKSIIAVFAMALIPFALVAQHLTLATRGQPAFFTIVKPVAASASQQYAAEELQKFTEQMTGVKLPIVADDTPLPAHAILLGNTRYTEQLLGAAVDRTALGEDGFRLKTCASHLLVMGSATRGTLYGVYELLERFGGCRWYTTWHSVIPQRETLSVPVLDETQKPAFALREPFWFDMFDGDLAARNKANGNNMRLTDKHGGKIRFGGDLFVHTFEILCPSGELFDLHPEYFSEINGKRRKEHTQLCLTNPDVLKIVTARLLERIRKDPTAKLFSVSQNDWYQFCTCPACKAIDDREESHAGTMITFVNQVAEAVEREFPNVWIETLAYQYTRKPPKTVRPRRNVVPRLCSIECDFAKPLDQSAFKQNLSFVEDMRGWSAMTDKLYVWDYTTNFRSYIGPFPNVLALQGNVRFFRDNHVVGLFEQGAYQGRHADFAELKAWLLAKWLWNPELPIEPLLKDFFEGYYGKAAPFVRQYFDEVHTFYEGKSDKPLVIFEDVSSLALSEDFLVRATRLWQQAEEAVNESPAHAYNVRMAAIPFLFTRLAKLPHVEEKKIWVTKNPQQYAVPAVYRDLASNLLTRCREAKNIRVSESGAHHDATFTAWRSLLKPLAVPGTNQTCAIVEDTLLSLGRRGTWGDTVADPLAEDGSAMKLYNTHFEWCTTLPFSQVAFDPGATYRIRMRVRVEKEPGREGQAFWSGVYDSKNKKSCGGLERNVSEVQDGYVWYDVAQWVPEKDHYFWIGPGRFDLKNNTPSAIRALYIDKLELSRVE